MRPLPFWKLASAVVSLGHSGLAAPAPEETQTFDVYPVEVVVVQPTHVVLDCAENGVYTVADDLHVTVVNAPTSFSTDIVRYSTVKVQHTVARCEDGPAAKPTKSWTEGECLMPGGSLVLAPEGDRKVPLTIDIPANNDVCQPGPPLSSPETTAPAPGTITTTKTEPNGRPTTYTVPGGSPNDPDTVYVIVTPTPPPSTITTTEPGNPTTFTVPGTRPGEPDTVIIRTPPASSSEPFTRPTVTTTEPGNPTTFTVPGTGTVPDTVIIRTPSVTSRFPSQSVTGPGVSSSTVPPPKTESAPTSVPSSTSNISSTESSTSSETPTSTQETTSSEASSTSEETPTPTPSEPTIDDNCDNTGFRYAIFSHNQTNGGNAYANLNIEPFRTGNPIFVGQTERFGFPSQTTNDVVLVRPYPDAPVMNLTYKAINHEAYLFSAIPGTYTVRIGFSDEIVMFWLGDNAYSGYTRANANAVRTFPQPEYEVTIDLEQGQYLPVRVLWVNAQGAYRFDIEIEDPAGNIIADKNGLNPAYFVQNTCEDDNTPDFPPFAPVEDPAT